MRPEKQLLLDEIKDKIAGSKALVVTTYKRLAPNTAAHFRMDLAKSGGSLEVVKKRVLLKAAQNIGVSLDPLVLQGHIAVVFAVEDPIETTKSVFQFRKENEDIFEVIGGRFEGTLCSAKDMELISKLPSKDEMRAQLLATFEAPMAQTLSVIEALLASVAHCLENKNQQTNS
ncbi:MAG: 50S ribosomal protein L10 [Verrucomicrobia bacterium]|nr:50S ribosomal protein L10 [Verrucomicrobiota bacterium]